MKKKIAFSLWRCRKNRKSHPHPAWESKKNIDSLAAWECDFRLLRHLCSENAVLKNYEIFVVVDFGGFWACIMLLK